MNCYYNQYCRNETIVWIFPQVNSKDDVYFAMLFILREMGKNCPFLSG